MENQKSVSSPIQLASEIDTNTAHRSSYIYLTQIDVTTCIPNISSHELFPFINSTYFILSSTCQQSKPYGSLLE